MARHCKICKIKLSFLYRKSICKHCQETKYNYYLIGDNILELPNLVNEKLVKLSQFGDRDCYFLYNKLFKLYVKNIRLTPNQIESLRKISNACSLQDRTLEYERKNKQEEEEKKEREKIEDVRDLIKKTNNLPEINYDYFDQLKFPLPKNEKFFLVGKTRFHERQILSSYQSGGERITEKGPKLKSEGDFIVSWNKFYYIPKFDGRSITIDLSKIIKYDVNGSYLRIRIEGRQKAYLFQMNPFILTICIIGLDFLYNRRHH